MLPSSFHENLLAECEKVEWITLHLSQETLKANCLFIQQLHPHYASLEVLEFDQQHCNRIKQSHRLINKLHETYCVLILLHNVIIRSRFLFLHLYRTHCYQNCLNYGYNFRNFLIYSLTHVSFRSFFYLLYSYSYVSLFSHIYMFKFIFYWVFFSFWLFSSIIFTVHDALACILRHWVLSKHRFLLHGLVL